MRLRELIRSRVFWVGLVIFVAVGLVLGLALDLPIWAAVGIPAVVLGVLDGLAAGTSRKS